MTVDVPSSLLAERPSFRALYMPKLVSVLREGYDVAAFRADIVAGLTVAIVALPLSMAIAIASGMSPERGLFTAVVGGFLISALGGSRFQVGGPAGAFTADVVETRLVRDGFPDEDAERLRRIFVALDLARYSRNATGSELESLRTDAETVDAALRSWEGKR